MKWFGKAYGAPYESDCEHVPTPVGVPCGWCDEPIAEGDDGIIHPLITREGATDVPRHYECDLRAVIGGANHQYGFCTCCGGLEPPDPPELSRREAAKLAVRIWEEERRP